MGRSLGCQIQHVGNRDALAEKFGAAGEVAVVSRHHGPPGLVPVPVHAIRAKGHAGLVGVAQRLVREGVEHKTVDAHAKRPVALILQRPRIRIQPPDGGERFGGNDRTPHDMGDGSLIQNNCRPSPTRYSRTPPSGHPPPRRGRGRRPDSCRRVRSTARARVSVHTSSRPRHDSPAPVPGRSGEGPRGNAPTSRGFGRPVRCRPAAMAAHHSRAAS